MIPVLRDASEDDIRTVHAIEMRSIQDPWSERMLSAHLKGDSNIFLVADVYKGGKYVLVGFVVLQVVADQAELLNIAVDIEYRSSGIASALLKEGVSLAEQKGAQTIFLEVRDSNSTARQFYARRSFNEIGRRVQYYDSPQEDAILLQRDL